MRPPSIRRFRARRAAQCRLVCIHWASCPDEQRSVGSMERVGEGGRRACCRQLGGLAAASLAKLQEE
eukprot:438138-Prymnesium_polylepis.1